MDRNISSCPFSELPLQLNDVFAVMLYSVSVKFLLADMRPQPAEFRITIA